MADSATNSINATPQAKAETTVSRGEFIRSLGMSSAALMAFYCMGTLSSCKGSSDPSPAVITPGTGGSGVTGNASTSGGAINFTIDLSNSNFTGLKTAGGYVSVGDIIVFNASGSYKALSRICTHQGGNLIYSASSNDLICDLHSSHFTIDGAPKSQPVGGGTITAVKAYSTSLSGNSLTVKA
ncbi:Rieske 2Fe-2S domain-containing protein [Fibrella arboris]|uniref:Rieske 2Fe-2S domain-containing protein n=1 Tax=Fibrella arboris TaxID=3242486 RepID=UPI00351FD50D